MLFIFYWQQQFYSLFSRHKNAEETEDLDDKYEAAITMENRIPCHTLDLKAGQINRFYAAAHDNRFMPLWT